MKQRLIPVRLLIFRLLLVSSTPFSSTLVLSTILNCVFHEILESVDFLDYFERTWLNDNFSLSSGMSTRLTVHALITTSKAGTAE